MVFVKLIQLRVFLQSCLSNGQALSVPHQNEVQLRYCLVASFNARSILSCQKGAQVLLLAS